MKINFKKIVPIFYVISTLIILFAPYTEGRTLGSDSMRNFFRLFLYLLSFINIIIVFALTFDKKKITLSKILFLLSFNIFSFV